MMDLNHQDSKLTISNIIFITLPNAIAVVD